MKYFPRNDHGILLSIIRRLQIIVIAKGEFVYHVNELGNEMYFVIEGKAEVLDMFESRTNIKKKKETFGEIGIMNEVPTLRGSSVRAVSDLTLGVLSIEDFNYIKQKYPVIKEYLQKRVDLNNRTAKMEKLCKPPNSILRGSIITSLLIQNDIATVKRLSQINEERLNFNEDFSKISISHFANNSSEESKQNEMRKSYSEEELSENEKDNFEISKQNEIKSEEFEFKKRKQKKSSISPYKKIVSQNIERSNFENLRRYPRTVGEIENSPNFQIPVINIISDHGMIENSEVHPFYDNTDSRKIYQEAYPIPQEILIEDFSLQNSLEEYKPEPEPEPDQGFQIQEGSISNLSVVKSNGENSQNSKENSSIHNLIGSIGRKSQSIDLYVKIKKSDDQSPIPMRKIRSNLGVKSLSSLEKLKTNLADILLFYNLNFLQRPFFLLKRFLCRDLFNFIKFWLNFIIRWETAMFLSNLFFVVYYPLNLAFESYEFTGIGLVIEILSNLVIYFYFGKKIKLVVESNKPQFTEDMDIKIRTFKHFKKVMKVVRKHWLNWFLLVLMVPPFSLIFTLADVPGRKVNPILIFFQLFRVLGFVRMRAYLRTLKKQHDAIGRIVEIILGYFLMTHIIACLFVLIGNLEEDPNLSWFCKIPAPQLEFPKRRPLPIINSDQALYINALYWAYVTTSHIGIGDVSPVNYREKLFSVFVIMVSILTAIYFFGNLVSIIEDLSPEMKSLFQKNFKKVTKTLKELSMEEFQEKIEEYFNFVWKNSHGIDENAIFADINSTLVAEIQIYRYSDVIMKSPLFKIGESFSQPLAFSLIKFLHYEIFISDEPLQIAGQSCSQIYLVLEGQVELVSFDLKHIAYLKPGDYFGCIFEERYYPCHAIAYKITKVGILSQSHITRLAKVFPIWKERLYNHYLKLKKLSITNLSFFKLVFSNEDQNQKFDISNKLLEHYSSNICLVVESLTPECKKLDLIQNEEIMKALGLQEKLSPPMPSNIRQRSSSIVLVRNMQKNMNLYKYFTEKIDIDNTAKRVLNLSFLHLTGVLYTTIMLPVYVCFNVNNSNPMIVAEALLHLECAFFFYFSLKTYLIFKATFNPQKMAEIASRYVSMKGLIIDAFGIIPINLILAPYDGDSILISFIRISRMIMILRLNQLLERIEGRYRKLTIMIVIFKNIVVLIYVWHWSACIWYYFNLTRESKLKESWINQNDLLNESPFTQYIYSSLFTLNIATTTGYPEQIVFNNEERIFLIFIVYLGNALFSLSFGILSSFVSILPEQYTDIYENSRKINMIFNMYQLPHKLRKKIDKYIIYLISLRSSKKSQLSSIKNILPNHLFDEFMYGQVKPLLMKLPVFSALPSSILKEISKMLSFGIFLPDDYIIYKDDLADEMYFLIDGSVNILSPNESKVIKTLHKGDYFGEIAVFTPNTRRICSVVANAFCQLYRLTRTSLEDISKDFPEIATIFIKEGSRRLEEYKSEQIKEKHKETLNKEFQKNREKRHNSISKIGNQRILSNIKSMDSDSLQENYLSDNNIKNPNNPQPQLKSNIGSNSLDINSQNLNQEYSIDESENNESMNEYVGNDEMNLEEKRLQSRRIKGSKNQERRYSRLTLGKELILSKFSGLSLQWGLNNS